MSLRASSAHAQDLIGPEPEPQDLGALDLRALTELPIVAVARVEESVSRTPAAVYVLTHEDLVRAGVLTLPDALRLVPGVQVARISSSSWAISVRGFAGQFANKLLVLVDGRSVYTPLFSGVYWDAPALLAIDEIERIEVVRGPGGSLWGTNAVNGVINVVTRSAARTQGTRVEVGGGSDPRVLVHARHGGEWGEQVRYRFFARHSEQEAARLENGSSAGDQWRSSRGGLRLDSRLSPDSDLSVWAEVRRNNLRQNVQGLTAPTPPFSTELVGWMPSWGMLLMARYEQRLATAGQVLIQGSWERISQPVQQVRDRRTTGDVNAQHGLVLAERLSLTYGGGYRRSSDDVTPTFSTSFRPTQTGLDFWNWFADGRWSVVQDQLHLGAGLRADRNDYTGWELQPCARLWWQLLGQSNAWTSVTRAVRIPSRLDRGVVNVGRISPPTDPSELPVVREVRGNPEAGSESLVALEAGTRVIPSDDLWFDLALFRNRYQDLLVARSLPLDTTSRAPDFVVQPAVLHNAQSVSSWGGELAARWQITGWQTLQGSLSVLRFQAPANRPDQDGVDARAPAQQGVLRSSTAIGERWTLDLAGRWIGAIPELDVPSYVTADARIGWRPHPRWAVSAIARNLGGRHLEFQAASQRPLTLVRSSFHVQVSAQY